jgi:hypothetical protein
VSLAGVAGPPRRGYIARVIRTPCSALALVLAVGGSAVAFADDRDAAIVRMRQAVAARPALAAQAATLASFAWPDDRKIDPPLAAAARAELILYGDAAIPALRERLEYGPAVFGADVLSALLETRLVVAAGRPADFVPAIDTGLWASSPETARLAMYAMREQRFYRPALLPMIDRALEHPELLGAAIRSLAEFHDDRARFFLGEQMRSGPVDCRGAAARALATIGGLALETLREATLADDAALRATAIDALLPVTTVGELATLFEYIDRYPEDDAARVAKVRERALHLDRLLQSHQASEAANPN